MPRNDGSDGCEQILAVFCAVGVWTVSVVGTAIYALFSWIACNADAQACTYAAALALFQAQCENHAAFCMEDEVTSFLVERGWEVNDYNVWNGTYTCSVCTSPIYGGITRTALTFPDGVLDSVEL